MDGTRASMPGNGSCGLLRIAFGEQQGRTHRFSTTEPHHGSGRCNRVRIRLDWPAAISGMAQAWPEPEARAGLLDLAFLYPSQAGLNVPGGALTHVAGFLSGLAQEGARSWYFPASRYDRVQCAPHTGSCRLHLFREAATLSYNIRFIAAARKLLAQKRTRLLYQRHGRFLFAGALLSRLMGIPLVLEYNASEDWMAKYWIRAFLSVAQAMREGVCPGGVFDRCGFESAETTADGSRSARRTNPSKSERS